MPFLMLQTGQVDDPADAVIHLRHQVGVRAKRVFAR
jgi:hypothetical protein